MKLTPEGYAKALSQLDHLRADVTGVLITIEMLERRVTSIDLGKATSGQIAECRANLAAARDVIEPLLAKVAEVTKQVYGYGPGNDDRERALRSCQGKKSYRTPEGAGTAAASRKKAGAKEELRVYACGICFGHHLTSVPLETFAERAAEGGR